MAEITIRFSRAAPPTLWKRVKHLNPLDMTMWICKLTHSPFSHVDLLVPEGLLGASDNLSAPFIVGNPRGVAIRPIDYQRFSIRHDAVLTTSFDKKQAFENFCRDQLRKPFDREATKLKTYLAVDFGDPNWRNWRDDALWYCAEMIGRAAEVSKLLPYEMPSIKSHVTAADLLLYFAPIMDFDRFMKPIATPNGELP